MRIRADEHIAPAIVRAVIQIALSDGFDLTSVLLEGFKGTSDVHWITAFAAEGGDAILTADTDFLKQPPQVQAVERTGMKVIHLPSAWANASLAMQAGHILIWWQRIEAQLEVMKQRQCFQTPYTMSDRTSLKQVAIDYHGMNKKAKKAARRDSA